MVILFSKNRKKDLCLLAIAGALIVGLIIFWLFFLNREEPFPEELKLETVELREQRINIDFELLESELIKQLRPFEFIVGTSTDRFGRDNPFAPNVPVPNL